MYIEQEFVKDWGEIPEILPNIYTSIKARRCNWCYNILKNEDGEEIAKAKGWCSEDCKQEEEDFNFVKKLTIEKKRQKLLYGTKKGKDYQKEYHLLNRKKRLKQMKEYHKKLLNKNK